MAGSDSSIATYKAHGQTQANLLYPAYVQFPGDDPGKYCEDEVHDDVVN